MSMVDWYGTFAGDRELEALIEASRVVAACEARLAAKGGKRK